jgi:hypothetical protein
MPRLILLFHKMRGMLSYGRGNYLSKGRPDVEHLMLRRLMNCNELDLAPKRAPERHVRQMAPEHDGGGDLFAKVRLWYGEDDCRCQTRMIQTSRTSLISRGGR